MTCSWLQFLKDWSLEKPGAVQRDDLRDIWMAPIRAVTEDTSDRTVQRYKAKYPKAMSGLVKDRDVLLTFYGFQPEHCVDVRTSDPIESAFAAVCLRSRS